jgi:hypothetical protein
MCAQSPHTMQLIPHYCIHDKQISKSSVRGETVSIRRLLFVFSSQVSKCCPDRFVSRITTNAIVVELLLSLCRLALGFRVSGLTSGEMMFIGTEPGYSSS